jgi:hypothetical protein
MSDDNYPTPAWCVDSILRYLTLAHPDILNCGRRWLEASAGDGAIIAAANAFWQREDEPHRVSWTAVELRRSCRQKLETCVGNRGRVVIGDFLSHKTVAALRSRRPLSSFQFDVSIGNPPYSLAMEFVRTSMVLAKHTILLLRTSFLESEKRVSFMQVHCPDVYVLPNRPCFVDGHSDSCSYAWMHWDAGVIRSSGEIVVLPATPRNERASRTKRR